MAAGDGAQLPATVAASRSVEKALEEAAVSGALNLSNRRLKEFPGSARNYDLSDVTHADLSKNRLCELPEELCQFMSLETLSLYHNGMRSLSSSLSNLQALTYLNLSRNLLSSLPPSLFQLPFLRVLIVSNNKLCSLSASIYALAHLRQLDVSCNELQSLPSELGQLECLRDLNLRRNQLTSLPEEIAELPLVRLDASCNGISRVPLCYRHLRQLQSLSLDNNPLQTPPAHVCSRGKYHIFKYLHMEACRRSQEELERQLRPTGFSGSLTEQELFPGQLGGLDSGFSSVGSGSKRWSGNESTDDFSERSLRTAEVSRDRTGLEEEREEGGLSPKAHAVNGGGEHLDSTESSVTEVEEEEEEEEDVPADPPSALTPVPVRWVTTTTSDVSLQEQKESCPLSQAQDGTVVRPSFYVEECPPSPPEDSPASPSTEPRKRPGTLLLWQERERLQQQQREKASGKCSNKTGSHAAPNGGSGSLGSPEKGGVRPGVKPACANAEQTSGGGSPSPRTSPGKADATSPQRFPPPSQVPKPSSFLFRTSSHSNVRPTGSVCLLGEAGRSESCVALRSPKEERPEIAQLRKTLESQLKISLPDDLGEALSNGTVLCQLANHVRPRSVSIIHVPSPAVPKLSSAKCRLNVENFLAACRKLGLPEDSLGFHQPVMEDEGLSRLSQTVRLLVDLADRSQQPPKQPAD